MVRWCLVLALLLSASVALIARPAMAEETLRAIQDRGVVRIAVSQSHPNMIKDLATGTWSGPHTALYRAVFEPLGVDVEFVETPWGSMVAGLQSGTVDITLFSVMPARALAVDYSDPIYVSPLSVLLTDGSGPEAVTWADLNREDFRIVVTEGGIHASLVGARLDRAHLVPATDNSDSFLKLESGRADGVLNHIYALQGYVDSRGQGRVVIPEPSIRMANAFAIRKGSPALMRYLNTVLMVFRLDGTLRDIYAGTDTQRFLLD